MKADELTAYRLKLRHELEAADEWLRRDEYQRNYFPTGKEDINAAQPHLSELCITAAALLHELRREQRERK